MAITIHTSSGKTFSVNYAYAPVFDGSCMAEITGDSRLLSQIAADFEGLEWIEKHDPDLRDETYTGYSILSSIVRQPGGAVTVKMLKP